MRWQAHKTRLGESITPKRIWSLQEREEAPIIKVAVFLIGSIPEIPHAILLPKRIGIIRRIPVQRIAHKVFPIMNQWVIIPMVNPCWRTEMIFHKNQGGLKLI